MNGDLVGMLADCDLGNRAEVAGVENMHRAAGPIGDEQLCPAPCENDVIRSRAGRGGLQLFQTGRVESRDRATIDVERIKHLANRVECQPTAKVFRFLARAALGLRRGFRVFRARQTTIQKPKQVDLIASTPRPPDLIGDGCCC